MPHFDDLTFEESARMLDAIFPPGSNARKVIDSTPPDMQEALGRALIRGRARERARKDRHLLMAIFAPDQLTAELEEEARLTAEADAALNAMTPADWRALEETLQETERGILRSRGIDPV